MLRWCSVLRDRWVLLHYAVRASFSVGRWSARACLLLVLVPLCSANLAISPAVGLPFFGNHVRVLYDVVVDFLHKVVVYRRDVAVRGWRSWVLEDGQVHPYRWLKPDLVAPACVVILVLLLMVVGLFQILIVLMSNFVLLGFLSFVGQAEVPLIFLLLIGRLVVGSLAWVRLIYLPLLGSDLYCIVQHGLDGWAWMDLKAFPEAWFDWLAVVLSRLSWMVSGLRAYLMLMSRMAMLLHLGNVPCVSCLLFIAFGRLSGFVADVVKSFDTVDRGVLDLELGVWVFLSGFVWFMLVTTLMFGSGLSLLVVLVRLDGGIPEGCPLSMIFIVAFWALVSIPGVRPQLYADNLKCVSGSPAAFLGAARFSRVYIRLVGQEAAPKKCVFLVLQRGLGVI